MHHCFENDMLLLIISYFTDTNSLGHCKYVQSVVFKVRYHMLCLATVWTTIFERLSVRQSSHSGCALCEEQILAPLTYVFSVRSWF
jgi:ABC-type long-subunit fatty acid transport system fused permease/ATPase subunit